MIAGAINAGRRKQRLVPVDRKAVDQDLRMHTTPYYLRGGFR
jgi:hypothetical protein